MLLEETDKRKQEFIERFNRLVAQLSTPAICQNVVGLGVGFTPPSEMSLLLGDQQGGAGGQSGAAGAPGMAAGAIGGVPVMMSALGARQSGSGPSSGRGSQGSSALGFVPTGSLHTSAQGSAGEPRAGSLAGTAPSLPLAPGRAGPDTGRVPAHLMHHGRYVMCYQVLCDYLDNFAEVAQQLKQAAIHETGIAAVYVVGQKSTLAAVQADQAAPQESPAGGDASTGVGVAPPSGGGSGPQSAAQSASSLSAQARLVTLAQTTFTYASQPLKIAHSKPRGPPGGTRKGVVSRGGPGAPPYTAIFPAELNALAAQAVVFFAPPVAAAPASASASVAAASGAQQAAQQAATASSTAPAGAAASSSLVAPAATPRRASISGPPPMLGPGGALTVPDFVRSQLELTLLPRLSSGGFALNSTDLVAGIFWQHYREKLTSIARNMLSDSLDNVQMIFRHFDDH